jgi:hypothetical protein
MIEAHKIGVSLAMTSNHAQVLGALAHDLLGVEKNIKSIENSWTRVGTAIGGAFAIVTGGAILRGLVSIIEKTKELSHEMSQIEKMGISATDRQRMQQEAIAIVSRHPGVTQSDSLSIGSRANSRTGGDVTESIRQMEILSVAEKVLAANRGDYTLSSEDSGTIFRAAENLGRDGDEKAEGAVCHDALRSRARWWRLISPYCRPMYDCRSSIRIHRMKH